MPSAEETLAALRAGAQLAVAYNPMLAVFAAPVAAALAGVKRASRERIVWAVSVVAIGWLVGDGLRVLARARDVYDFGAGALADAGILAGGSAAQPGTAVAVALLVTWGLGSLFFGYVLPVWAGSFVGRRVTHGTGWVAAASLAVGASLALSALAGALLR